MSEEEKDKLIDDIVEVTRQCCDFGFNEGLADRLAEQLVEKLVKKLIITDVGISYSEKQVDDAYDKGFKDAMVKYRK